MHVHVQVIKPVSSKLGSARCQWIIVIQGKGLPAISTAATTAVVPWGLRLGFIDNDLAAVEAGTVEFLDSLLRLAVARHLDETKASALTRITIRDHVGRINHAALAKRILQSLLGC